MQASNPKSIVGRYAPSPTGDLHLGNLRTGLIAWLHSRTHNGRFLMRIEDVDTPRTVTGSADKILRDWQWLGLDWDDEVTYQSQREQLYRDVLSDLASRGLSYPCFCSRKDIQQAGSAPHVKSGVYPGTCANLDAVQINELSGLKAPAIRVRVSESLKAACGDFVLHRADKLYAYQLAVVVDDLEQGISDVVRGDDLADSTARQHYLARLIDADKPPIRYHHVPLMLDQDGKRMSKRDGSDSIQQWRANGGSATALLAHLAHSAGLIDNAEPLSAEELLHEVQGSQTNSLASIMHSL